MYKLRRCIVKAIIRRRKSLVRQTSKLDDTSAYELGIPELVSIIGVMMFIIIMMKMFRIDLDVAELSINRLTSLEHERSHHRYVRRRVFPR